MKSGLTKRAADFWESAASSNIFLALGFFCSQALSQLAQNPLTPAVRPHVFFLMWVRWQNGEARTVGVLCLARKRGFPAIVFSVVSFFSLSSGLIGLVSKLGRLARQQVSHMDKSDRQVVFFGNDYFGCGVLLAVVS